ncbi:hypothetical protein BDY21DRAFT_14710 [Lineolata rhizophorae]|uniref:Uncharacterized protein n=1 Tax=Lineolata rhizophorae TaxID=578093 RepID=A0A6A6PEK4_9PEZI|nr:hypothetical protein BDY21DRAFT_14710 [Lineolata rhizophorae]
MATDTPSAHSDDIYARLDQYPFASDEEFLAGLNAILSASTSPEQSAELALRARCFYFQRKFNIPVDYDLYKDWRQRNSAHASAIGVQNGVSTLETSSSGGNHAAPTPTSEQATSTAGGGGGGGDPSAPYPTSFAHIVELITTGQPVPGIKEIPSTVLEGQGTQSTKPKRKKPWEKDAVDPSSAEEATSS